MNGAYAIYLDITNQTWLSAINNPVQIEPSSLGLFLGDCLPLSIYPMVPLQTQQATQSNYAFLGTAGWSLGMFLSNGETGVNQVIYSQYGQNANAFLTDPNYQYFYTNPNTPPYGFPLNTPALIALLGNGDSAQAYLDIALYQNGEQWTVFHKQVTITVGAPVFEVYVAPPETALSLELARNLIVPVIGAPGQGFWLTSPLGKKLFISAMDNPDGNPSLGESLSQ